MGVPSAANCIWLPAGCWYIGICAAQTLNFSKLGKSHKPHNNSNLKLCFFCLFFTVCWHLIYFIAWYPTIWILIQCVFKIDVHFKTLLCRKPNINNFAVRFLNLNIKNIPLLPKLFHAILYLKQIKTNISLSATCRMNTVSLVSDILCLC